MQSGRAIAASAVPALDQSEDRAFYIGMGLFMLALSILGFAPSLLDQARRNGPPTPLVLAHGFLTVGWILLFATQASLVRRKRVNAHRRLGQLGFALTPAVVGVGSWAIVAMLRRGYDLSGDIARGAGPPGSQPPGAVDAWIPFGEFSIFAALAIAALVYRHRAAVHKRLMLLALVSLALEPLFHLTGYLTGRWPGSWMAAAFGATSVQLVLLFSSAIHDRFTEGRVHPVSLWGPVFVLCWVVMLGTVVAPSAFWHGVAGWLEG